MSDYPEHDKMSGVQGRPMTPDADPRPLAATQGDETAVPASTSVRDGSGAQNGAEGCVGTHAPIRSYVATLWSTHCEECGGVIDEGFTSATSARDSWDNDRAREGRALCDEHWVDPDEATS